MTSGSVRCLGVVGFLFGHKYLNGVHSCDYYWRCGKPRGAGWARA